MLGVVFVGLVILTSSPYSSDFLFPAGGWSPSRVLLCVRVRRLGAFGFMEVVLFYSSSVSWVSGSSCSWCVCVVFSLLCCTLGMVSYY